MKPLIGLMPLWDDEKESLWMLPGYMDGIATADGIPFMLPLTDSEEDIKQLVGICNGFLFTGGHDVSPELYAEKPIGNLVSCCRKRDIMENIVLRIAIEKDKPILGICRGIQFINAALGGTLYQDLPTQHPTEIEHHQKPPYDQPVHKVDIVPGSPLYSLIGESRIAVNSYHHQAIKQLAPSLVAMAYSEDGLVEAVHKRDQSFMWAVQWHPEFMWMTDVNSRKIFKAFISISAIG